MKERPILFSAPMVRTLLAGTKTQTRRAFSPRMEKLMRAAAAMGEVSHFLDEGSMQPNDLDYVRSFCPYGQPGDRLWVRETWAYGVHAMAAKRDEDGPFVYAADGTTQGRLCERWTPSIHMPRWACRITLDIKAVRIERLQSISEADAEAEGIDFLRHIPDADETLTAKQLYECLWDSINGAGSWAANPWVWVVEFERAQAQQKGQ